MRQASAIYTLLLVCLASVCSSRATVEGQPGGSTNLLWVLSDPSSSADASAPLWAINATLNADSIVFHGGSDIGSATTFNLVDITLPGSMQISPQPLDPKHLDLPKSWSEASTSGYVDARDPDVRSPWKVSMRPVEARSIKLVGKSIPKLADQRSGHWVLNAQRLSEESRPDIFLLGVVSMGSDEARSGRRAGVDYTIGPTGQQLVISGSAAAPSAHWLSGATLSRTTRSFGSFWKRLKGLSTAPVPVFPSQTRTQHLDSVRAFIRGSDGAYVPLLRFPFSKEHQSTADWSWPSALRAPGRWASVAFDGKVMSERLRHGCHRAQQALKQASPFNVNDRPSLATLRDSLPRRPHFGSSRLSAAVQGSPLRKTLAGPARSASGVPHQLLRGLAKQWTEADGPKQTFMAVFAVLQVVWLACTVKGWLDRLFGRKAEYRNRRTKTLARKAALAAVGGCGNNLKPKGTWSSGKPRLPPRPSPGHPLMPLSGANARGLDSEKKPLAQSRGALTATNELETTASGEIVLPSWTESGPSPLMVIVEEPELEQKEEDDTRSKLYSHPKKRCDYERMAGEWDDDFEHEDRAESLEQGWSSSNLGGCGDKWSSRLSLQSDTGSLRYRERRETASLPFFDDVVPRSTCSSPNDEGSEADLERTWRDSCMEEGVFDARH